MEEENRRSSHPIAQTKIREGSHTIDQKMVWDDPDEVLVVAAILGDLEAFDELAARYRVAVVRLSERIVGPGDAEDVAQDSLLLAFQALPSIENPECFASWLMTITRNRALRFSQNRRRMVETELSELLLAKLVALTPPPLEKQEEDEELNMVLQQLPDQYALVLQMRFFDELPLERISAFLGVPLSTVKWRIFRGKQLFRDQLKIFRKEDIHGKRKRVDQTGERSSPDSTSGSAA